MEKSVDFQLEPKQKRSREEITNYERTARGKDAFSSLMEYYTFDKSKTKKKR